MNDPTSSHGAGESEQTDGAEMSWGEYVRKVINGDKQSVVAEKTGIDQTTISRWLSSSPRSERRISSQAVAQFARGYGRDVLEAFVAAGFLTPKEAGIKVDPKKLVVTDLSKVDNEALMAELRRRMSS